MTLRSSSLLIVALALTATVASLAGAAVASAATTCAGLAAAITASNADLAADVIDLEPDQTCTLTAPLPRITGDLTIYGHGSWLRPAPGRAMVLLSGRAVTVDTMTLTGGTPAVSAQDSVTLDHVTLQNNPGGAVRAVFGDVTVRSSRIAANRGVALSADKNLAVRDSELVANDVGVRALQNADVRNSLVRRNGRGVQGEAVMVVSSTVDWNGRALSARDGHVGVVGSRLTDNGTAAVAATLAISDSTVARNGIVGTGAYGSSVTRSSLYDNEHGLQVGGGRITNSTFAHGEDLALDSSGRVDFSTITGTLSTVHVGPVIYPSYEINASILGNCDIPGWLAATVSGTANVSPDGDCPGLAATGDPRLLALTNNGGPTPTLGLAATSPARDLVPAAECNLATDQRGLPRPSGPACDAGAFEAQTGAAPPVVP